MSGIFRILLLVIASVWITGCALIPATAVEGNIPALPAESLPAVTPQLPSPSAPPASPTGDFGPTAVLPEADQVIFTVPNAEPWSGREGDPRPDWKGWGAETFSVAPDGTFWIADTAVYPNRLLQYNAQGKLLEEISLQDIAASAYDLLATEEGIWVLDVASEQPKVVQLSPDGQMISTLDIPKAMMTQDGSFVSNGAFALLGGEGGELLVATINGYYELIDASGKLVAHRLEGLTYSGHTYQEGPYDPITGGRPAYLDETPLQTGADFMVDSPLVGFNADGSFAVAGYAPTPDNQSDGQVMYFDAAGNRLGTARQRPQTFYKDWNHHLAFGPDGRVYQLLSNLDRSVQVLRLGFSETLPPRPDIVLPSPTPLAPLSALEPAATDEAQARNTLIQFFADLSAGNYAGAAPRFGGELDPVLRDPQPGESVEAYWEYLCGFYWCLPVAEITDVEQVSENEVVFYTVFMHPDGTRFEIGACCGSDPAATPPVWQFAYPVQKLDGEWKVMRPPIFTP